MTAKLVFDVPVLDELLPALGEHAGVGTSFATGWPPPAAPGVYVWVRPDDEAVTYIGSAASLARRLGREKYWVDGHDPDTDWEVTVVHMLKRFSAVPRWHEQPLHADAVELERRLIEWHRVLTGVAPLLVGWDAKTESATAEARNWAQRLWSHRQDH